MDVVAEGLQDSFINDFDDGSIGPGRLSAMSAEDDTSSFVLSRSFAGSTVTELSSVFSMSEDDFDKMASRRARLLFDDIDSMLFEHQTSGPPHLIKECLDWQTKFPHLRVLGQRVMDHEEEGFHLYPTNPAANTPMTGSEDVKATSASNNLLVHGRHFDAVGPGLKNNNSTDGSSLGNVEEVLEENGTVEEILAIDYRYGDEDFQILGRKLPNGRPPITPFNCVKDNIISSVFNHLLMQVFPTFKPLLQKIVETVAERNVPDFQSGLEPTDDLEHSANSVNNLEKNSRLPALSNSLLGSVPENAALDGVLTIRSKMLLNRERTLGILDGLTETVHGQTIPSVRLNPVLFGNGHATERHSSLGRIRLLPLENARPQSLVPTAEIDPFSNANLDGLRGHRLATTLSSTTPTPKLPPLQSQRTIMSANVPNTIINRPMQSNRRISQRAISAVQEKEAAKVPYREKDRPSLAADIRPTTTQSQPDAEKKNESGQVVGQVAGRQSALPLPTSVAHRPSTALTDPIHLANGKFNKNPPGSTPPSSHPRLLQLRSSQHKATVS